MTDAAPRLFPSGSITPHSAGAGAAGGQRLLRAFDHFPATFPHLSPCAKASLYGNANQFQESK